MIRSFLPRTLLAVGLISPFVSVSAQPVDQPHAGMLRYPDVSATHIVFAYANDLWTVPREGGVATPLSSPDGAEAFARFSPDGSRIAFVGNYEGGRDIYTIPTAGGVAHRVTYHPSSERLTDWLPSGEILFSDSRLAGLGRQAQLYLIDPEGGMAEQLPVPYGANATISDDGGWLIYTPMSRDFRTWKRYRGGNQDDIWMFNLEDHSAQKITDWEGTDTFPMFHDGKVYYLSDAGPEHRLNIWSYDPDTQRREQITTFADYDVKWPAMGPGPRGRGEIVFQNGSGLFLLDLGNGRSTEVKVTIPGDRPRLRTQRINASNFIADWTISATGKRAVVEARGDIWTLPAEKGFPRNLTNTDGVAERLPMWSPDGRWISYFSDATGEYELYVTQSDGKGETKQLTEGSKTYYYSEWWSPDSKHLLYWDKAATLRMVTPETGEIREIYTDPWAQRGTISWSHDSRWIAYDRTDEDNNNRSIWAFNLETGEHHRLTSGMFDDSRPAFDRKGDYLYFVSSRSFSPTYSAVDTSFIYQNTELLLAAPLRDDVEDPWKPELDEETWDDEEDADKDDDADADDEDAEDNGDAEDSDEADEDNGDENGDDEDAEDSDEAFVDDGVSGTWEGTATGGEGMPPAGLPFTMTLRIHEDNSVTGSVSTVMYSGDLSGSWDPDARVLSLSMNIPDGPSVAMTLTVTDGEFSGTAEADGTTVNMNARRTAPWTPDEEEEGQEGEEKKEEVKDVEIDIEGFEARAFVLPTGNGAYGSVHVNDKNQVLYAKQGEGIKLFDITDKEKSAKDVESGVMGFHLSGDGKKMLFMRGGNAHIRNAAAGGSSKPVNTDNMVAMIDPRDEWRQVFIDAWRIQRDFFYVENLHGVDWPAVRDRYLEMIDSCNSREDVSYVIGEMIAELNVGHTYYWGGGTESESFTNVGMLGVDYALENGAYRISRIIRGGDFDVDARGPLDRPGIDVKEGDYLLAVNGVPVDTTREPWAAFVGLAGKITQITVSESPVLDDTAREVIVEPMGSESGLRFRNWIERNRAYVEEKTGGRVGYIYVPDTGVNGQNELVRQYFGQLRKDGLIIDERWNGGGQIPTRFIEMLNRTIVNYWARRDGMDWPWPPDGNPGPKCMLINGPSGSGGDAFPHYFRHYGLGKLIGTRTWGGLVGISGNPALIDGGYTSVPTFGFYETDGTWGIEGHGVDPDIEVIDDPSLMVDGGDPQLDAAIAHMLEEIERNPYNPPQRPEDPVRTGIGIDDEDK